MYILDASASFAIEQQSGVYVYDIVPVAGGIVSISSDDTLRLFDPSNLHHGPVYSVPKVNSEITCLEALDYQGSIVCTAGRDGKVTILDLRQRLRIAEIGTGKAICFLSVLSYANHEQDVPYSASYSALYRACLAYRLHYIIFWHIRHGVRNNPLGDYG
jgi:WD40 repeat protein